MNLLIVWDRMGDYHRSRVKTYKNLYSEDQLYTADLGVGDKLYSWHNTEGEEHYVLSDKSADQTDIFTRFKNFKQIIKKHQIDKVILSGYGKLEYILFTVWLRLKKIDTYMFAESWYPGRLFFDYLKGAFLRSFVKGVFASGKYAEQHFSKRLNFPERNIEKGYSIVDNNHFEYQRKLESIEEALKNRPILLCVARYAEEKNLELLINAFKESKLSSNWKLQLIGGGPLKEDLEIKAKEFKSIELLDWQSYEDLPSYYKKASCFILPSIFEPWGLVVNEAMAASLPVILSTACGCFPDLMNKNGYAFNSKSKVELVEVLNKLSSDKAENLYRFGLNSYNQIKGFTPTSWSKSLKTLIS